ncbi:hypothetical protein V490_00034 [Pseudogymnoascus sp. VKM F-3557]|nr:hypothetical protein V490_00034 [Pseudogymnoascus sp. VKM F-3557]
MARRKSLKAMDTEARMAQAVDAYQNREFKSLKATAEHSQVSRTTLTRRMSGHPSRVQARQDQQPLSPVEESTLIKWICSFSYA